MEKKFLMALNAIGVVACAATCFLLWEIWGLIKPLDLPKEMVELNHLLEARRERHPLTFPEIKKKLEGKPETARGVAVQVIERHIDGFMLKSFEGACGMNRQRYISAIAEALMKFAHDEEEAFWLTGMMQAESSFRLGAKPGKTTNSSARGLLQVITRWHQDVLKPEGITKEDLASDVTLSVQGGILVFHKYRFPKRGAVKERSLPEATRRYRSLRASEAEHRAYQTVASAVCEKLKKAYRKEVDKK